MKKIFFAILAMAAFSSVSAQTANCISSATLDVTIEECIGTLDVSALTTFSVSPNPNDGRFVVELASVQNGTARITVADALGRTILTHDASLQGSMTVPLSLKDAPKGAYWVSVMFAGRITTKQVVLE